MSWFDFAIITASVALTMLACRVIPVFALKGRTLPSNAVRLLNLIPPAAFVKIKVDTPSIRSTRIGNTVSAAE